MTGSNPHRFVVQRFNHYTSDCSCQTTAKLCSLCEEYVNIIHTVADPDPNPIIGGQLPQPLPDPNEWNPTLMSGTGWGQSPHLYHINWGGVNYLILTSAGNECNSTLTSETRGETLTPNPNEYHSTLTSAIRRIYPLLLKIFTFITPQVNFFCTP